MPNVVRGRESGTFFKGFVEGGPEMAAKLAQLEKDVRDELLVQATQAGADVIADEWRAQIDSRIDLGPGTAHYRDAVGTRARPGRKGATAWVGLPNDVPREKGEAHPREYAPKLEFGSRNTAAKPTLRPAFDAAKGKALDAMAAKVRHLLGMA